MAAMMICLGASAIDKVVKKVTLTGEVTSVAALQASGQFLLQDEGTGLMLVALDGVGNYWDFNVATPATMVGNDGKHAAIFKLDKLSDQDHFRIEMYNINGSRRGYWGGDAYVNTQPVGGNVIFGLDGSSPKYGQDGQDLALWDVSYEAGKGFAFKNVGRPIYIGSDGSANARPVDDIVYWKAYAGFESAYVAADVEAAGKTVEAALKASDASAALATAKAAYEADKTLLDAYAEAINAAIDVIDLCEKINQQYAGYTYDEKGAAAVAAVVADYNAGKYKDAAALMTAYTNAVKAQRTDGADMTGAIYNPSFELGNINGWTSENAGNFATNRNFGKLTGDIFVERWTKSPGPLSDGEFYQEITGLPNGEYTVTAEMQNLQQSDDPATDAEGYFLEANGEYEECTEPGTVEVKATVTDGTLTIGALIEDCTGNWVCVDNFTLTLDKCAPEPEPEPEPEPGVVAEDDWFKKINFCFRDKASAVAENQQRSYAVWGVDPDDPTNGCIVATAGKNSSATNAQFWIRGAEYVEPTYIGEEKAQLTAVYGKGGFDAGTGFKITMRVKADGEYSAGSQTHSAFQYKSNDGFGTLNVTKEWQTVSFTCIATDALAGFTDLTFNLAAADADRTFYFDDIKIVRGSSEWYLNCGEIHAKDYLDPAASYTDSDDPHPFARFVNDSEGGYVEVISNANRNNPWDSQIWIGIPSEWVGKSTKMTMEVYADKAVTCPESYHATATGKGWGASASPGSGLVLPAGEWTTITRVLRTEGVKCNGVYKDMQVDYYCLDLSNDEQGSGTGVTYKFRNIQFGAASEAWYDNNVIVYKDPAQEYEDGKAYEFPAAPYVYGTGAEGGYVEVKSKADPANAWASQIFFSLPSNLVGKIVDITMKVKASKAVTAQGQLHDNNQGDGYTNAAAPSIDFTTEWADVAVRVTSDTQTAYVLNLANDAEAITYDFDEVAFAEYIAPVEYEAPDLASTEQWYQDLAEQGVKVTVNGEVGYSGKDVRYIKGTGAEGDYLEVRSQATSGRWDTQMFIQVADDELPVGTTIKVAMKVKTSEAVNVGTQAHAGPQQFVGWNSFGTKDFTTDWSDFSAEYTVTDATNGDTGKRVYTFVWDLSYESAVGDASRTFYFDEITVAVEQPIGVDDVEWADDNLVINGNLEGNEMSSFVGKIQKGHAVVGEDGMPTGEYVYDEMDPEILLLEKTDLAKKAVTAEEPNGLLIKVGKFAPDPDDETKLKGNAHDSQLWIRLSKVIPAKTVCLVEFDYQATNVSTIATQTHNEPGQWLSNDCVGSFTPSSDWQHFQFVGKTAADLRSIAFNLGTEDGGTYRFDNFVVKIAKDQETQDAVAAATAAANETTLWAETLALNEAIHAGKTTETEGKNYTAESVQALTDAVAAGRTELDNKEASKESLTAAAKAIEDAIAGLEKGGVIEDCDLTADMFFTWDAVDATASKTGQAGCAYDIEKSTGMPYGDGSVNEYNFADLTAYDHLAITATEGEPRLLFNRAAQDDHQGPISVELPRDFGQNKYEAVVDNGDGSKTYVINLKAITEKDGYAHLHAIKGANWQNTTVTAMKLFVGASEYSDVLTNINGVEDGASVKDGKYIENGQIVIVKGGKKYTAAGVEIK